MSSEPIERSIECGFVKNPSDAFNKDDIDKLCAACYFAWDSTCLPSMRDWIEKDIELGAMRFITTPRFYDTAIEEAAKEAKEKFVPSHLSRENPLKPRTVFLKKEANDIKTTFDDLSSKKLVNMAFPREIGECIEACNPSERDVEYYLSAGKPFKISGVASTINIADVMEDTRAMDDWLDPNVESNYDKDIFLNESLSTQFFNEAPDVLKDYLRPDAPMNLQGLLPESKRCQLGPLALVAFGSDTFTGIHEDICAAYNVMVSAPRDDNVNIYAVWYVFPRSFRGKFSPTEFTSQDVLYDKIQDEVHWMIEQKPGDVIVIPAGLPHGVLNFWPSLKVAVDFVTPWDFLAVLERRESLRRAFQKSGAMESSEKIGSFHMLCLWALRGLGEKKRKKRRRG